MLHALLLIIYMKKYFVQSLWKHKPQFFCYVLVVSLASSSVSFYVESLLQSIYFLRQYLCNNALYANKLIESFNWLLIFLISIFSLFFCRCLYCNSSSRIIGAIRCLSLMLVPLVANQIVANVGINVLLYIFSGI